MTEDEKAIWMKAEASKIIKLPGGREIGATMTNWHWTTLDWMTKTLRVSLHEIVNDCRECDEGKGFDLNLTAYIEYFFDRYDKEASFSNPSQEY